MARVTVEDCVKVVPNRFELCLLASTRAKAIIAGSPTALDRKEKPSVISLREIAATAVDVAGLKQTTIRAIKNRGIVDLGRNDESFIDAVNDEGGMIVEEAAISAENMVFADEAPQNLED